MFRLALVLAIVSLGLSASLYSRFAALLLYLWFAFFRPQDWVWVDITSLRLSLVIGITLVLPALATGTLPNVKHPLSRGMILLVLLAFVAELVTPHPRVSWDWLQFVGQMVVVDLLLITIVDSPARLRMVAAVVAGSIAFHASKQGLVALLKPGLRVAEGIGGSFGDNNSYAVVSAMLAVLLLGMARAGWARRSVSIGFGVAGLLCVMTVISTYSRGGFLAVATGLSVFALLVGLRFRWLLAVGAVVAVALIVVPIPDGYAERMGTIKRYEGDESASSRLHFWKVALQMSAGQPLGVGIQNFNSVYDDYDFSEGRFGSSRSVHNSHLQTLTEAGFVGFVVWIFLLSYALLTARRVRARALAFGGPNQKLYVGLSDGLVAALCAFVVGGTFTAVAWNDFLWCLLAMTAALDRVSYAECRSAVPMTAPAPQWQNYGYKPPVAVSLERPIAARLNPGGRFSRR